MMSSSKQEMLQALLKDGFAATAAAAGSGSASSSSRNAPVDPEVLSGIESRLIPMGFSKQQVILSPSDNHYSNPANGCLPEQYCFE